jgi:hypothetical protein
MEGYHAALGGAGAAPGGAAGGTGVLAGLAPVAPIGAGILAGFAAADLMGFGGKEDVTYYEASPERRRQILEAKLKGRSYDEFVSSFGGSQASGLAQGKMTPDLSAWTIEQIADITGKPLSDVSQDYYGAIETAKSQWSTPENLALWKVQGKPAALLEAEAAAAAKDAEYWKLEGGP